MGIASIEPTIITLAPAQEETILKGAAEIAIRQVTNASEVKIALDDGPYMAVSAGERFEANHQRFRLKNDNAVTIVVEVRQSAEPGTYHDQRDTATSVSIGGSFAVTNAPLTDEGGAINRVGTSNINSTFDNSGGAAPSTVEVITAAANTGGVYLRLGHVQIISSTDGARSTLMTTVNPNCIIWQGVAVGQHQLNLGNGFYVPSGLAVSFTTGAHSMVQLLMSYTIL